jgi:hypothetical protein
MGTGQDPEIGRAQQRAQTTGKRPDFGQTPRPGSLGLSRTERDKHLYVCGVTGTGKSKFLENLIRQDIRNWSKSKCGLLVIDPHGNLYDNLINWLAWTGFERPIIPIDLRQDDWVVSYNLLRQRQFVDPAVLVDNLVDAIAYVWGQRGTNQTPLFARWAGKQRQGVARLVGMNAPVSIYTPDVGKRPGNEKKTQRFLEKCYKKLPFSLPTAEAQKQIADRADTFAETLLKESADEPATAKRKIR